MEEQSGVERSGQGGREVVGVEGEQELGKPSRIPEGSMFYERLLPWILIGLGVITLLLILVAAGVLLGIVPYQ